MIFRTLHSEKGTVVSVEDDDGVLFTVPAADKKEATALVKKAVKDGHESIRPAAKKVKTNG